MGEPMKQARIDNWAMFVMSRLQIFFNKTDYCDLTLQFEGNVQLKVHRVIMNACTDYFLSLEQEIDMVHEDILVMPPDLQADVILPIVNFMYTGILEYEENIFEKLYKTAELMNITVLLKFLDAQKVKIKTLNRVQVQTVPKKVIKPNLPPTLPGRKLPVWKRKNAPVPVQINPVKPYSPETTRTSLSASDPLRFDNTPKPTRFEWPDEDIKDIKPFDQMPLDSSFDGISYSCKPLMTQEEEMRATFNSTVFDDLRQLPTSKPVKLIKDFKDKEYDPNSSVDMEDLKSYVKEQKIRSGLADYDEEDPDDPDFMPGNSKRKASLSPAGSKKPRLSNEKENLVEVRTSASSKVDHSKIISEVLKKYPQLVQKNKNIRLKILQKNKPEDKDAKLSPKQSPAVSSMQVQKKVMKPPMTQVQSKPLHQPSDKFTTKKSRVEDQTWECTTCTTNGEPIEFVLYYLYRKHMTDVHHKQFDARDCKHCGALYEQPLRMAYHMYMSHAVLPQRNIVFPKCGKCAYIALDKSIMQRHLAFHTANPRHSQCPNCKLGYNNEQHLKVHMQLAGHNGKNHLSFDCQYCTRQLNSASSLFVHCKTNHLEDGIKDGMLSLDEDHLQLPDKQAVKVISNQKVSTPEEVDSSSITSSLGPFDLVVLDDQQQYILQDNQASQQQTIETQQGFMTLPELQDGSYNINQGDIGSTDELVMVLTDHDYNDGNTDTIINNENSNIVVLYSHPVEGQPNQFLSQGNIMLNSETGMLEIHNEGVAISTQSESIEMIQKEVQSHGTCAITSTTDSQKIVTSSLDSVTHEDPETVKGEEHEDKNTTLSSQFETFPNISNESFGFTTPEEKGDDDQERKVSSSPCTLSPLGVSSDITSENKDDDREKKVIAVEAKGTGQLTNTIEEVAPSIDSSDFAANISSDQSFGNTTQMQSEPMEIDEDLSQSAEITRLTTIEETSGASQELEETSSKVQDFNDTTKGVHGSCSSIEPSQDKSFESETGSEQITKSEELKIEQEIEKPSVSNLVETAVQEIPQELLEPNSESQTELINQSCDSEYDQYKTCASLSVSEQCPEEPMEVDGCAKSQQEVLQPSVEEKVLQLSVEEEVLQPSVESSSKESENPVEVASEKLCQDDKQENENIQETNKIEQNEVEVDNSHELDNNQKGNDNNEKEQEQHKEGDVKEKQEISTLLNDWEDTDSQQSDTGKGTSVNKLINDDWDDD